MATPRDQLRLAILQACHEAVAIELDLVDPVAGGRHTRRQRRKLGWQLFRQSGSLCSGGNGCSSRGGLGSLLLLGRIGERMGNEAVGQRGHYIVVSPGASKLVALLEENPGLLLLSGFGDFYEFPESRHLLTVQAEDQFAFAQPFTR